MKYLFDMCAVVGLLLLPASIAIRPNQNIITWGGNTRAWDRALHLTAVRIGCSGAPSGCVHEADQIAAEQGVQRVFLAILLNPIRTANDARDYSQLSLSHPELYEVGFDDFVGQCEKLGRNPSVLSPLLGEVVHRLKSANPNLHFGITLYQDQLSSAGFPLGQLSAGFRQQVDFVHLYSHYRREPESFGASVQLAKQIFPSAQVIAGIYAYDRRDYLPCAPGNSTRCTNQEEMTLFERSFRERLTMMADDNLDGIEFYPGGFGKEASWQGWEQPRSCQIGRRAECITNTVAMRQFVRKSLDR